jgi:hypothetical protein
LRTLTLYSCCISHDTHYRRFASCSYDFVFDLLMVDLLMVDG